MYGCLQIPQLIYMAKNNPFDFDDEEEGNPFQEEDITAIFRVLIGDKYRPALNMKDADEYLGIDEIFRLFQQYHPSEGYTPATVANQLRLHNYHHYQDGSLVLWLFCNR